MTTMRSYIRYPRSGSQPQSLLARQVATAYDFPISQFTGKGYTAGIIELGGGYTQAQVTAAFTSQGLPVPTFVAVSVDGGKNKEDGADNADGEVQLDLEVAGSIAPGATFRVYFAGNTDADFLAATKQALVECDGVSLSWGGPESQWDQATMNEFEAVIKEARGRDVPFFVAAGDSGADDGTGSPVVDFPSSSPSSIGCGGTRLTITSSGARATETVWDDSDTQSATGGGVSTAFPGRDVPDIAGNADPDSGYEIIVDGESVVVGGTSAVAPLMLGLHALLWEAYGGKSFDMLNLIVTNPQTCFDVTSGDNGAYRAGPGRDENSGYGVPNGALLLKALTSGIAPPVTSPPVTTPPVTVPPTSPTTIPFPTVLVNNWLAHKHNYSSYEKAAATALVAYAAGLGITLKPAADEGDFIDRVVTKLEDVASKLTGD